MRYIMGFGAFWYDFIIGDDWTIAAAVVVALAVMAALVRAHLNLWWFLPAVVVAFLGVSLWRLTQNG